MYKRNKFNLIKSYNFKNVKKYFNNEYINKKQILHLKKCVINLKRNRMYLHLTPNLEKIIISKKLVCSSGGLGGVVYSVPVYDGKIHNLGIYIFNKELPMFLKNNNFRKKINGICIIPKNNNIGYVDYLEFGECYYYIYKKNNYLVDKKLLEKYVNNTLKDAYDIINLSYDCVNINMIFEIMNNNMVLKVFLFECILEYLFLFQKKLNSKFMNNEIVKDIIYELSENLKVNFSLSRFNVDFNNFYTTIVKKNLFFSDNIKEYLNSRIVFYLKKYILKNKENLYGHVIFRNFNIRNSLEINLAKILWKEAKRKNYGILTYIIPKGELGILPFGRNKIYNCYIKDGFCFTKELIDVKIVEEIFSKGIMRNPYVEEV